MSRVRIVRGHHLGREALEREVERLAAQLVARHGGRYQWEDDSLTYRHPGLEARVSCGEERLELELAFGALASLFKGRILREVEDYLDAHLS
ncbi:MAG: hypothetical protein KatS3mg124_0897 [Porticoccaceae bacterium]|nr:MAG: hypothetical protein KatS3mg124_0897 [Porticoccaceae bacterium]